ncbi:Gfo/Idh/MocA family oxidoreductase [Nitrosopumilus sp. S4]
MSRFYDWITKIDSLDFNDKSALVIGGSEISRQYLLGLRKLGIKDITTIAKSGKYISKFCKEHKIKLHTGGFEKNLSSIEKKDIVIVAPPIQDTIKAAKMAIENKQDNILIEKPGSLYSNELESTFEEFPNINIRVAYNRLAYPNFFKLKELVKNEGGITSCRFTFTERLGTMDFEKDIPEVYQRWGISNSLHVITMAFELIGMPDEIHCYQYGNLEWHPSGSIFIGDGISNEKIPFSYHADWGSGGRWGIEVNTKENSYQLIPLEDLFVCKKDTGNWNHVDFKVSFQDVKQGITEEIAIMLDGKKEFREKLPSLKKAASYNQLAEKIFGY